VGWGWALGVLERIEALLVGIWAMLTRHPCLSLFGLHDDGIINTEHPRIVILDPEALEDKQ